MDNMKTVCIIDNKIVMSQDGEALEAMTLNAAQYEGAVVQIITNDAFDTMMAANVDKLADCKAKAKELLAKTDWAVLPDVGLTNQADFITYRSNLRTLVLNPVAEPVFGTEPTPIWSN